MLIISVRRQWNDNGVLGAYWLAEGLACAGPELLWGVAILIGTEQGYGSIKRAQEEGRGPWIQKAGSEGLKRGGQTHCKRVRSTYGTLSTVAGCPTDGPLSMLPGWRAEAVWPCGYTP